MQIQLQQNEIEQALRLFIQSQGISLEGREVGMSFTAGRKNNGVTVDLDIHDQRDPINTTVNPTPSGPIKRQDHYVDERPDSEKDSVTYEDNGAQDNGDEEERDAEETVTGKTPLFGT